MQIKCFSILYNLDYYIAYFSNELLHSIGKFITPILKFITILGNGGMIFISLSIIFIFFHKTRKSGVIALVALFLGVIITNLLLKNIVARPRPFINQNSCYYLWWKDAGMLYEKGYSFPSGHTTAAMAFAFTMVLCFKKNMSWIFLIIPLIMGYSRVYFIVHYTSDVLFAFLIGIICSFLSFMLFQLFLSTNLSKLFFDFPSIIDVIKRISKK